MGLHAQWRPRYGRRHHDARRALVPLAARGRSRVCQTRHNSEVRAEETARRQSIAALVALTWSCAKGSESDVHAPVRLRLNVGRPTLTPSRRSLTARRAVLAYMPSLTLMSIMSPRGGW